MSIETNKALVKQFYGYYQKQDWEGAKSLTAKNYRCFHNVDTPRDRDAYFVHETENFDAIPGFKISVVDMIAEGDKVAAYLIIERNEPSPKFRFSLLNLITFADGKIIEKRAHYDLQDILQQLNPVD
jgi:predicted ester cyclase